LKLFFLTVGFSGLSPKASGTVGTIVSLPIGVWFLTILPPQSLFLFTVFISIIAIKVINLYEAETGTHDSKIIVIDELAGIWLALAISITDQIQEFTTPIVLNIIFSFIYFRIFDIWKPSIIGKIDENVKGGLGVMGDDILAGIVAGLLSAVTVKVIISYLL
jgi:phosphatidylglycerophosphatase A